jgi:hypothetical protein
MPVIQKQQSVTETVEVPVSKDAAGVELNIGDTVTLTFKITHIHCRLDGETGLPTTDDLELSFVKPNGYHVHMGTFPATMVNRRTP